MNRRAVATLEPEWNAPSDGPQPSGRIERPEIEGELVGTVDGEEVLSIEVLGD